MGFNPREEVKNMLENPVIYEEYLKTPKKIGKCNYRHCKEDLYEGEGFEWDGYLYCTTECMGEHLVEENIAVDLSA